MSEKPRIITAFAAAPATYFLGAADADASDDDMPGYYREHVVGWAVMSDETTMPISAEGLVNEGHYILFSDGRVESVNASYQNLELFLKEHPGLDL